MNTLTPTKRHQSTQPTLTCNTLQTIAGINQFGFRLLSEVASQSCNKNLFVSPVSIAIAFAMLCQGAEGETRRQIHDTFGLTGLDSEETTQAFTFLATLFNREQPEVELLMANSLWQSDTDPVNPCYVDEVRRFFGAENFNINFNQPDTAEVINGWVAEKTKNKITQLVKSSEIVGAVMALLNAVYFKASWRSCFDKEMTLEQPFMLLDGSTKLHPLMRQVEHFDYFENEFLQAIDLRYGSGDYRMTVILPQPSLPYAEFQQGFDKDDWQMVRDNFQSSMIELSLPRFTIAQHQNLNSPLQQMGITNAFAGKAEFCSIGPGIFISLVLHQATLAVNEEGAEASAATAIVVSRGMSTPPIPIVMTVDRPFLCTIYEANSGVILFAGHIVDPS